MKYRSLKVVIAVSKQVATEEQVEGESWGKRTEDAKQQTTQTRLREDVLSPDSGPKANRMCLLRGLRISSPLLPPYCLPLSTASEASGIWRIFSFDSFLVFAKYLRRLSRGNNRLINRVQVGQAKAFHRLLPRLKEHNMLLRGGKQAYLRHLNMVIARGLPVGIFAPTSSTSARIEPSSPSCGQKERCVSEIPSI